MQYSLKVATYSEGVCRGGGQPLCYILRTHRVTAYSAKAKTLRTTRAAVEKDCKSRGQGRDCNR